MKVHSLAPFEFRGGLKLPKGESDFDADALKTDQRSFFDGLVKAAIVTILDETPALAPAADTPVAEDTKAKAKKT